MHKDGAILERSCWVILDLRNASIAALVWMAIRSQWTGLSPGDHIESRIYSPLVCDAISQGGTSANGCIRPRWSKVQARTLGKELHEDIYWNRQWGLGLPRVSCAARMRNSIQDAVPEGEGLSEGSEAHLSNSFFRTTWHDFRGVDQSVCA